MGEIEAATESCEGTYPPRRGCMQCDYCREHVAEWLADAEAMIEALTDDQAMCWKCHVSHFHAKLDALTKAKRIGGEG